MCFTFEIGIVDLPAVIAVSLALARVALDGGVGVARGLALAAGQTLDNEHRQILALLHGNQSRKGRCGCRFVHLSRDGVCG